ncbi:hypothetical protein AC249_AIPGENE8351 [Exaiptasia diaphana]|nr:hypothetical protein AC249_AIPGENE8351 [Exaiptasia diaphana]
MSTSSSSLSDGISSSSSSSRSSSDEFLNEIQQQNGLEIQGYMFQPTKIVDHSSDSSDSSSESSTNNPRLQNSDWCKCDHCQIMDHEVECVCCQEINEVLEKNQNVSEVENIQISCITDNPGFKAVCLNQWVLEAAWHQYTPN